MQNQQHDTFSAYSCFKGIPVVKGFTARTEEVPYKVYLVYETESADSGGFGHTYYTNI